MTKLHGKKGQTQLLSGLVIAFAAVIFLMALLPTINSQIEVSAGNLTEQGADSGTTTIMRLIPLFMILALIIAVLGIIQFSRG